MLRAFFVFYPEHRYWSGMSFVAQMLLAQVEEESDGFYMLMSFMANEELNHGMYDNKVPRDSANIERACWVLDRIVKDELPDFHNHLLSENCSLLVSCRTWFMTMFTTALPAIMLLQVWDMFLASGFEFLYRVALYVLKALSPTLLGQSGVELMVTLAALSTRLPCTVDALVKGAVELKFAKNRFQELEDSFEGWPH